MNKVRVLEKQIITIDNTNINFNNEFIRIDKITRVWCGYTPTKISKLILFLLFTLGVYLIAKLSNVTFFRDYNNYYYETFPFSVLLLKVLGYGLTYGVLGYLIYARTVKTFCLNIELMSGQIYSLTSLNEQKLKDCLIILQNKTDNNSDESITIDFSS